MNMDTALPSLGSLYGEHLLRLQERTNAALAACKFDRLAIYAGRCAEQFLDDQVHPFKVNPHFKHWLPLVDAPDSWLIIEPGTRPRLIFLQPVDYWHRPPDAPSGYWVDHFDVSIIRESIEATSLLRSTARTAFIGEWRNEFGKLDFSPANPADLLNRLHYGRACKTAYEIECMSRATQRAVRGHRAAEQVFRGGGSEFEMHLAYLEQSGQAEHELPYGNIIACDANAAVLHYQHLQRQRRPDTQSHTLLIDAGAQYSGYACDITRSYARTEGEFADLIAAMDRLQLSLCAAVRAGVDFVDLQIDAHRQIAALLRDADIISLHADAAVESGLSGVFFPHGLGHLIGLQVHDVGGHMTDAAGTIRMPPPAHPYLRLTRRLEPGFVVTIEPGVYFIDQLLAAARSGPHHSHIRWSRVDQLQKYGGIRIEDNVRCTHDVPDNLTRPAFAALALSEGIA